MSDGLTPDHPRADELYSSDAFRTVWRKAARKRFVASVSGDFDTPAEWAASADLLEAWLDTWSLAALTDPSLQRWRELSDATALTVLGRGAEVIQAATGWRPGPHGPWPTPASDWLAELGIDLAAGPDGAGSATSGLLTVPSSELATRRAELARAVTTEGTKAVQVDGAPPTEPAGRLALGELRMEATHQDAWDRFGVLGLTAEGTPPAWSELRGRAPGGAATERPSRRCEAVFAPGPASAVRRGELGDVGYLLWEGPFEPIAVQREAVVVTRALDGTRAAQDVAAATRLPLDFVEAVIAELVAVGAAGEGR